MLRTHVPVMPSIDALHFVIFRRLLSGSSSTVFFEWLAPAFLLLIHWKLLLLETRPAPGGDVQMTVTRFSRVRFVDHFGEFSSPQHYFWQADW